MEEGTLEQKTDHNLSEIDRTIQSIQTGPVHNEEYFKALVLIEMLPESIPRDPFYAALTIGLTRAYESESKEEYPETANLLLRLINYFKEHCKYFKNS